ncbi:unnamed protein product [Calicophoron daubneyi]|uniref:Uncharacterized protein n=1 Tax=Calicophoron daubneyi TaxID=300641 RepID=A0AAV2T2S4_CALDB
MSKRGKDEHVKFTAEFEMSEEDIKDEIISVLLSLICSSFEYITDEDMQQLRSVEKRNALGQIENGQILTSISTVVKNAKERMARGEKPKKDREHSKKEISILRETEEPSPSKPEDYELLSSCTPGRLARVPSMDVVNVSDVPQLVEDACQGYEGKSNGSSFSSTQ